MDSARSFEHEDGPDNGDRLPPTVEQSVKIWIGGGLGVGKTTFIASVSEIDPLSTEAAMTDVSLGVDDVTLVPDKVTTTVAFDFGRITLNKRLVLYLFGAPGQERFRFVWDDLLSGSLGAVVIVDTRRLDTSFEAIDFLESKGARFVVAVNSFEGAQRFPIEKIRPALALSDHIPIVNFDARNPSECSAVLLTLMEDLQTALYPPTAIPERL